ncbi:hypothetical protein F8154_04965 [Alkaliphilus pronyensis]|uniref:Flagellar protein n=1 Tax=Alkaliphilus pronyensis TaxID=1482732 RepID=A0A6I0FDM2_9FIRM|nr:flagellar biosynthetic protein FliO [Alkaliphilus pronyensis]KAB3535870.1 hypothetical protein F8154_04965 [Alkaliphilus pronyensis]
MIEGIFTVLTLLLALAVVLFLAYGTTLLIGKKSGALFNNSSVKVLERVPIGQQADITIIQIHNRVYILAMQSKNIEVIDTMEVTEWHLNKESYTSNTKDKKSLELSGLRSRKLGEILKNQVFKKGDEDNNNENNKH